MDRRADMTKPLWVLGDLTGVADFNLRAVSDRDQSSISNSLETSRHIPQAPGDRQRNSMVATGFWS